MISGKRQKKFRNSCNASSLFCTTQQDERKKHQLGMAVVAKGVSPPDLGLWLVSFFASSETESAAQPGRALGFCLRPCAHLVCFARLCAFEHIRFENEHPTSDLTSLAAANHFSIK
jgi:hypothetical protein